MTPLLETLGWKKLCTYTHIRIKANASQDTANFVAVQVMCHELANLAPFFGSCCPFDVCENLSKVVMFVGAQNAHTYSVPPLTDNVR